MTKFTKIPNETLVTGRNHNAIGVVMSFYPANINAESSLYLVAWDYESAEDAKKCPNGDMSQELHSDLVIAESSHEINKLERINSKSIDFSQRFCLQLFEYNEANYSTLLSFISSTLRSLSTKFGGQPASSPTTNETNEQKNERHDHFTYLRGVEELSDLSQRLRDIVELKDAAKAHTQSMSYTFKTVQETLESVFNIYTKHNLYRKFKISFTVERKLTKTEILAIEDINHYIGFEFLVLDPLEKLRT